MRVSDDALPRRGFLERLATAVVPLTALSIGVRARAAGAQSASTGGMRPRAESSLPPDETWLRDLTGKHRTVFDVATHRDGHALAQAKGFLDAYEQAYDVPAQDVNLVLGVRGSGLPLVLSDAMWARYRIGEQYGVTGAAAATRNLFTSAHAQAGGLVGVEQTVDALQRRGVLVLVCNNTIGGAARKLASAGLGAADAIRADLLAGLLPGVVTVPAMVVAFDRMQARGISYVYAG
ncbi:MAG TPA: hypothetical protein VGE02_04770 [Gemmatimonadales bacterium]